MGANRRDIRVGWLAIVPAALLTFVVVWLPIAQAGYYSFTSWNGGSASWIGIDNYVRLFNNELFQRALINNAMLLLAVPFTVLVPFLFALLVIRTPRFTAFFRTALFLPAALSWVVTGLVGRYVFAADGQFNQLMGALGLGGLAVDWLARPQSAMFAMLLLIAWALSGLNFLIYLGGLGSIDESIYDAAKVDGAGPLRTAFQIVLPVMSSYVRFIAISTVTTMFGSLFALVYAFSGGGPNYGTTPLEYLVYAQGFSNGDFAGAASAGVVLMVIIVLVNLPQLRGFIAERQEAR